MLVFNLFRVLVGTLRAQSATVFTDKAQDKVRTDIDIFKLEIAVLVRARRPDKQFEV
jgi:hypothetical protein